MKKKCNRLIGTYLIEQILTLLLTFILVGVIGVVKVSISMAITYHFMQYLISLKFIQNVKELKE